MWSQLLCYIESVAEVGVVARQQFGLAAMPRTGSKVATQAFAPRRRRGGHPGVDSHADGVVERYHRFVTLPVCPYHGDRKRAMAKV